MANNKWTKWIVGLSGAVLFSGFVGYLSGQNPVDATSSVPGAPSSSGADQNPLSDQWDSQSGSSSGSSDGSSSFDGGFAPHGGRGMFGGDTEQADPNASGRLQTRAS